MLTIDRAALPMPEEDLRAALDRFKAALEHHRTSIGEPAPWPEHDVLRAIVTAGGEFVVFDEPKPPVPERTPEMVRAGLCELVRRVLDQAAQALGYDNIATAVTYAEEPAVPRFQREARLLRAWRSMVWKEAEDIFAEIDAGKRDVVTPESFVAELPPLIMPVRP